MKRYIFQGDLVIWVIFLLLCVISLIEVYSAGSALTYKDGGFGFTFFKQAGFLIAAAFVAWFVHHIPCRWFKIIPIVGFIPVVIMLLWALVDGAEINDGARWLHIPFTNITFQPSELAKGVLITSVALVLTTSQREKGAEKNAIYIILLLTGIICGLIVSQNLSTALMIFGIVLLMMWVGRIPLKQFFTLCTIVVLAGGIGLGALKAMPDDPAAPIYQSKLTSRMLTWHNRISSNDMDTSVPASEFKITDSNYQKVHARIAVARGDLHGVMPGNSEQREFLPQAYSDFIFSIIAEEMGIGGVIFVVLLYLILLIRAGRIASRCERNFPAFLIIGLTTLLLAQASLNMLVAVGLFPVTGQTLPMISRGGTSTIITGAYFGMILSISRHARSNGRTALPNVARESNRDTELEFKKN